MELCLYRVSFEIHFGDRHSAKNFNSEKQIAQFLKSEDITGSGIILIHDHKSVAKRKACLRQKRHRAGSVSLFCAIVSSSD